MKKRSYCLKNTHFWGKNQFSEIHEYLRTFWMDFVAAIGFLEAVYIALLLICKRNDFKGSLTTDIILNFKSVTFSVKQRENEFADPLIILLSI